MRLGWATAAGIAFHLAQLGVAGSLFGMIWHRRRSRLIDILAGVTWSFLWYFVMMRGFWKVFAPFVPRLMPQAATMFGVLLFGAALARVPRRAMSLAQQVFNVPLPIAPLENVNFQSSLPAPDKMPELSTPDSVPPDATANGIVAEDPPHAKEY